MLNRREIAGFATAVVMAAMGCAQSVPQPVPAPAPAQQVAPGGRGGAPQGQAQIPVMPDSIAQQNDRWVAELTTQIAGRENLPAEQVFKDIQLLQGTPANRMLAIMNVGYSRSLGVSCAHCHNTAAWESNERTQKKEARGMIRMVNMINEGNKTIPEFGNDPPIVNCTVCHRGSRRPVRNMPAPGGARGGAPGGQPAAPPMRTTD
ncbi:MAG: photosynthetic reaction center cytochrome c subunit family protein [Longimicrobiales bacterium]